MDDAIDRGGDWLIRQALERDADVVGLTLCRIAMTRLPSNLWDVTEPENLSAYQQQIFQRVLAALISTGALTAAVLIKPKSIEWAKVPEGSHPLAVARLLTLASKSEKFSEFNDEVAALPIFMKFAWSLRLRDRHAAPLLTLSSWTVSHSQHGDGRED